MFDDGGFYGSLFTLLLEKRTKSAQHMVCNSMGFLENLTKCALLAFLQKRKTTL